MGKGFNGCFNVFAWINNAFWGTLFIAAGVFALFWERNFAFGIVGIGIGIYFFWTKSWTRKTVAVIAGEDSDESDAPAAAPIAAVAPPGSVSQRKMVIKRVLVFASIMCLYLGSRALNLDEGSLNAAAVAWGALALACFFVFARTTIHRATEDALPALPWGAMFVAMLSAAFSPNTRRVSFTTQEATATSADEEAAPVVGGLSGNTKLLLIVALVGAVVIFGGMRLTSAVRAAWDYKLEGDYARLEAEEMARTEAGAAAEQEALEAETDGEAYGTGPEASEGEPEATEDTPAAHLAQISDLFAGAPQDGSGSAVTRKVSFDSQNSVLGESVAFTTDDPYFTDAYSLWADELTNCYIGDEKVSTEDFLTNAVAGMYHTGTITYTDDTLVDIRIVIE